jgi:hypothetical protein
VNAAYLQDNLPDTNSAMLFDRPCDTCYEPDFRVSSGYDDANDRQCPDCDGTGRHTFTVEAEPHDPENWTENWRHTYRVSVVPGMVEEQEDGTWRVQLQIH